MKGSGNGYMSTHHERQRWRVDFLGGGGGGSVMALKGNKNAGRAVHEIMISQTTFVVFLLRAKLFCAFVTPQRELTRKSQTVRFNVVLLMRCRLITRIHGDISTGRSSNSSRYIQRYSGPSTRNEL